MKEETKTAQDIALAAIVLWENLNALNLKEISEEEKDFLFSQLKKTVGRLGHYLIKNK